MTLVREPNRRGNGCMRESLYTKIVYVVENESPGDFRFCSKFGAAKCESSR